MRIAWYAFALVVSSIPFIVGACRYVPRRTALFWFSWILGQAIWTTLVAPGLDERHLDRIEWMAFGVVAAAVGTLVAVDVAVKRLPLDLSYGALATIQIMFAVSWRSEWSGIVGSWMGAGAMFAIAWMLAKFRTGVGRGDVHMTPLLGAAIGWFDPWSVLIGWFFALLTGGLVSAVLLGSRRVERRSKIPYGPWLALGSAIAISIATHSA